ALSPSLSPFYFVLLPSPLTDPPFSNHHHSSRRSLHCIALITHFWVHPLGISSKDNTLVSLQQPRQQHQHANKNNTLQLKLQVKELDRSIAHPHRQHPNQSTQEKRPLLHICPSLFSLTPSTSSTELENTYSKQQALSLCPTILSTNWILAPPAATALAAPFAPGSATSSVSPGAFQSQTQRPKRSSPRP
ncbi:hypothetical protein F5H01DRAFT_411214, partial [Linnemannia elongata]